MGHFPTLLTAAIARGLIAGGAGLELESALQARFPALPHIACSALGLIVAVVFVEAAAFAFEALARISRRRIESRRAAKAG